MVIPIFQWYSRRFGQDFLDNFNVHQILRHLPESEWMSFVQQLIPGQPTRYDIAYWSRVVRSVQELYDKNTEIAEMLCEPVRLAKKIQVAVEKGRDRFNDGMQLRCKMFLDAIRDTIPLIQDAGKHWHTVHSILTDPVERMVYICVLIQAKIEVELDYYVDMCETSTMLFVRVFPFSADDTTGLWPKIWSALLRKWNDPGNRSHKELIYTAKVLENHLTQSMKSELADALFNLGVMV